MISIRSQGISTMKKTLLCAFTFCALSGCASLPEDADRPVPSESRTGSNMLRREGVSKVDQMSRENFERARSETVEPAPGR